MRWRIRMIHIDLKKIKESIIKEVNIIELRCLQKKEKNDSLSYNNFVSMQDNVNLEDSGNNLDLTMIAQLF
jgi:hypothetical protein